MTLHLDVLGSSGSYPVAGRPGSGYAVSAGETVVWCDMGPGTYERFDLMFGVTSLSALVVSHQHADHCADLLSVFHAMAYRRDPMRSVPVYAPQQVFDRVLAFLDPSPDHAVFSVLDMIACDPGTEVEIGALSFRFVGMNHSVPTLGWVASAGSESLAYTADTGPGDDWVAGIGQVDTLVAEASLQEGVDDPYPYHLTAAQAGSAGRDLGVRRLVLTHIPPHRDPVVSIEQAEQAFGGAVALATPGDSHIV